MRLLWIPLLLWSAAPAAAEVSLDQIVDGVHGVYRQTRNFKARFAQKLTLRATKRKRRAGGKVYFQKPDRFRFIYTKGRQRKVIVSNGRRIWTFLRDERQVRIDPFHQKLASSLRFLWGQGDLRKQFDLKLLESSRFGRPGDYVLELVPKVAEGYYRKLVFVVDPKTYEVRETVVHDPVGNINHMTFSAVKRNLRLPARVFRFRVPKGVQVIESPELKGKK